MKKILMISYLFHPSLEIGAVRSVKFAKYLPQYGWEPFVLTVHPRYYDRIDDTPLDFECNITRTAKWPVTRDMNLWLKSKLRQSRKTADLPKAGGIGASPKTTRDAGQVKTVPLWRRIEYSLNWTPDDKIGWFVPAVRKAIKLTKENDIDAIYSSGPPWTCHLIGLAVKRLTGRKWVADYRDPWIPLVKSNLFTTGLSRRIENRMSRSVIRHADKILTTTPEHRDDFPRQCGLPVGDKCFSILNGYDDADFRVRTRITKSPGEPISFLYAGNIFLGRNPAPLLAAIGELVEERFIGKRDVKVRFIGGLHYSFPDMLDIIARYQMNDVVEFRPPVMRDAYLNEILNADVLILIQDAYAAVQIPGKTFEYLATGNQIVALASGGATYNFLKNFDTVFFAEPDDIGKIKASVKTIIERIRLCRNSESAIMYKMQDITKQKLTGDLAALLVDMVSPGRQPS